MSIARRKRREENRSAQQHQVKLALLLGDFYELLSKTPQPTNEEVREAFIASNTEWQDYCYKNKLMNLNHLFVYNVKEAWKRHVQESPSSNELVMS